MRRTTEISVRRRAAGNCFFSPPHCGGELEFKVAAARRRTLNYYVVKTTPPHTRRHVCT
nr:MAG TPA: hypothetical protein [Caudoviricetes sp.]